MDPTAPTNTGPAILLVDDDELSAAIMGSILEDLGHTIARAGDGKEALKVLESQRSLRLVITDLTMPEMDGLELTRHIRATDKFKDIQVVLLTGLEDHDLIRKAADVGCNSYLVKPVHPQVLVELVEEVLRPG